jgi:8-oxo-dGTP pyrophosphatase MutT (NUDIX family)
MSRRKDVEIIARGVCVKRGHLLLCHSKGARNTYLPGGHVEFGEPARESLRREIEEELGEAARVGAFLGAVEHRFRQKGERHCEINLVFLMSIPAVAPPAPPDSLESHIEFRWVPLKALKASRLEPYPLIGLVPKWLKGKGDRWASTF